MKTHTFLIEIGVEELPPKLLKTLAESLLKNIKNELNNVNITYKEILWFATPRRIAIKINSLNQYQNDIFIQKRGPKINQAFNKDSIPTIAAIKWANKNNIKINEINKCIVPNEEHLIFRKIIKGKLVHKLLFNIVKKALENLHFIKKMRWGDEKTSFIRPVHNILLMIDNEIINANILGIDSNRISFGHRFMGEKKITLAHANKYEKELLENGFVIVDFYERKEKIIRNIQLTANKIDGIVYLKENLLEEVTSLVEWPVVLMASFDKEFLSIPSDILEYIIEVKQKYFPIYDKYTGKLMPNFIFVANIISTDPNKIILDNENVLKSKLKDIQYFLYLDSKFKLEEYIFNLKNISFHKELGNYFEKISRTKKIASWIARSIGADIKNTIRSALLSKCDHLTNMVFEFPEMQGIIGMHYALDNNENKIVALAQKEQYQPRFAGDELPTTKVSYALAIADKIDTIVGIFGIGQYPKGYQDPFALRRSALGIIRIITEKKINLDLFSLVERSVLLYGTLITNKEVISNVIDFIFGRFRSWYLEKGYNPYILQATLSISSKRKNLTELKAKIDALVNFTKSKDFDSLLEMNRRIANILEKAKNKKISKQNIQNNLLKEPEELNLVKNLELLEEKIKPLLKIGLYQEILCLINNTLAKPINIFFNNIIILTENEILRKNRLTILSKIHDMLLEIADFSVFYKKNIK